ncbi:MAG TPA: 4-hydroxybenzoate octaprenyltransferase [Gammaproteobacteria bacterium]|nr:4-hydroxybenzoate octaprenyltransferase [Gammaproteobacteria bacterium]
MCPYIPTPPTTKRNRRPEPGLKQRLYGRIYQYYLLTRLNRPIGIYLLLWPTLVALWIAARGLPDWDVLAVFVLGVILIRSAGCVINDFADRDIDPHVKRTKDRPVASGKVSPHEALVLFSALSLMAFSLVLFMNDLTIYFSFGGVLLVAVYPFMKRYTYLPQVFLGAAFAWAVPMAFAAQTNTVPDFAWILFISTVLWATAYDTMYAMVDREDDLKIGVKSTAILFGDLDRIIIALIQFIIFVAMVMLGKRLEMGVYYYLGLVIAAGLAGYQQYLIRDRDRDKCLKAFLNNHWFGLAIFTGVVLNYL